MHAAVLSLPHDGCDAESQGTVGTREGGRGRSLTDFVDVLSGNGSGTIKRNQGMTFFCLRRYSVARVR